MFIGDRCEELNGILELLRSWFSIISDNVGEVNVLGCMSLVQDDANVDLTHTGTPALLHPGQRELGEGHPTQDPLPAGLWR